jgi:hypothetical protein
MKNLLLITLLSVFCIACNVEVEGDDENNSTPAPVVEAIKPATMDGQVGGNAWTFLKGRVKASTFSQGKFDFDFWDEDIQNPCDKFTYGSDRKLMGMLPLSVGTHSLNMENNITFFHDNQNNIATNGSLVIESIEGDIVRGKMIAKFDEANYANGEFELVLCQ